MSENENNEEKVASMDTASSNSSSDAMDNDKFNKVVQSVERVGNAYVEDFELDEIAYDSARNPIEFFGQLADNQSGLGTLFFLPVAEDKAIIAVGVEAELDYPREESNFYNIHLNTENVDSINVQRYDVGKGGMDLGEFSDWYNEFIEEYDLS